MFKLLMSHTDAEGLEDLCNTQSVISMYIRTEQVKHIMIVCGLLLTQEGGCADVSLLLRILFGTVPLDLLPAALHLPAQPPLCAAQQASCFRPSR